jgi:hypothetical protein
LHNKYSLHGTRTVDAQRIFLTLDITPGFILLAVTGTVHIGKAAKVAGVSVDTIRFYQEIGLIKSAGRSAGGYRLFDGEDIHDLTFVFRKGA